MLLRIKPLNQLGQYNELHDSAYEGDSGIDLFFPNSYRIPARSQVLLDFEIACEMVDDEDNLQSYFLIPRSSISRTPLRMSNSIGLIDSGYRGHIMASVDNQSGEDFVVKRGERLFQICHPSLKPLRIQVVSVLHDSDRGDKGFGSSGK